LKKDIKMDSLTFYNLVLANGKALNAANSECSTSEEDYLTCKTVKMMSIRILFLQEVITDNKEYGK
jgi:hypothetical protein